MRVLVEYQTERDTGGEERESGVIITSFQCVSSLDARYEAQSVILIVDDEPMLRLAGVAMVEDAGFEAIEASNSDDAIRILEGRSDVRLVFTDIDMPNGSQNGLRLAAAVRRRWPPIAIIVVSGHKVPELTELPEASCFYPKPYVDSEVVERMRLMLKAA